ncbi:hypothetical protein V8E55_010135 [Tylopilus felleus]
MSQEEDLKPKLNLSINYEGQHITVKVKSNMPFKKIFAAAEERFSKVSGSFRFVYEGKRLTAESTPAEMEMEDNDVIDAHIQQVGGGQ